MGPWVPVMPLIVGPSPAGGDSPKPNVLRSHATHPVIERTRDEDEGDCGDERDRHEDATEREYRAPKRRR